MNPMRMTCLLAVALTLLIGCDTSSSTSSTSATQPSGASSASGPTAKKPIVAGFAQTGAESGWRTANTDSIKSEAAKRGIDLKFSDAQQKQDNQIKAIRNFIAQKVDVIMVAPIVKTGWTPVFKEARQAGIPIVVSDRRPDVPEDLYVTFIGSDFVEEGRRA